MIFPIIFIVGGLTNAIYAVHTKNYYAAMAWAVVAIQGIVQLCSP